jgi:cyclophilin family peptidyl-prolyl cis-trans isomerase/protein-disulfide isomerase
MTKPTILFFFVSLVLVSCGGVAGQGSPTPTEVSIIMPTPRWTGPTCSSFELQPTPAQGSRSLFPSVSENDHIRGAPDASVTLVVYNDFQCSDCNYLSLSKTLLERHPGDLRIVYRPYPYLAYFDKAELAARAAEAAAIQDKFWEMHDLLFTQQAGWSPLSPAGFESWLVDRAIELGLDQDQFRTDFNSTDVVERVQAAAQQGAELGIPVLPFFLRNDQIYTGPTDTYSLDRVVSLTALGSKQFDACPPFVIYPERQYLATLQTEGGQVVIELFPDSAPLAVNSFVFLARAGWYDGITFHNVIPGYAAQTGDPSATGLGNPGYLFENESDTSLKFDRPGRVAMFNTGPDTNGSQFFITYQAAPDLNGKYTIFGQVLSGMQILEQLSPREEETGQLLPPGDSLISVTIEEK